MECVDIYSDNLSGPSTWWGLPKRMTGAVLASTTKEVGGAKGKVAEARKRTCELIYISM